MDLKTAKKLATTIIDNYHDPEMTLVVMAAMETMLRMLKEWQKEIELPEIPQLENDHRDWSGRGNSKLKPRRRALEGPLDPALMTLEPTDPQEQAKEAREEIYKALGVRPTPRPVFKYNRGGVLVSPKTPKARTLTPAQKRRFRAAFNQHKAINYRERESTIQFMRHWAREFWCTLKALNEALPD